MPQREPPQTTTPLPAAQPPQRYVYVYGTLRAGGSNDITRFEPSPVWMGTARTPGRLFDLGTYPGALLSGPGELQGEVYAIAAALEQRLDSLEGIGQGALDGEDEYRRCTRTVVLDTAVALDGAAAPGQALSCLVYEIHPARIAGKAQIGSGDWMAHARAAGL